MDTRCCNVREEWHFKYTIAWHGDNDKALAPLDPGTLCGYMIPIRSCLFVRHSLSYSSAPGSTVLAGGSPAWPLSDSYLFLMIIMVMADTISSKQELNPLASTAYLEWGNLVSSPRAIFCHRSKQRYFLMTSCCNLAFRLDHWTLVGMYSFCCCLCSCLFYELQWIRMKFDPPFR